MQRGVDRGGDARRGDEYRRDRHRPAGAAERQKRRAHEEERDRVGDLSGHHGVGTLCRGGDALDPRPHRVDHADERVDADCQPGRRQHAVRHVLEGAEVPVSDEGRGEGERDDAEEESRDDCVDEQPAVAVVLGAELDGDGLEGQRAERHGVGDADRDVVDGEHVGGVGGAGDERGNHERRAGEQESTERQRERVAELLREERGEPDAGRFRAAVLRAVREIRDARTRVEVGEEGLDPDADREREEPPARSDEPGAREDRREEHGRHDARDGGVVGLRAFEVVEEHHQRHVPEEESGVGEDGEDERPAGNLYELRRKVEESAEDPGVEGREGRDHLQRAQGGHQGGVEALEGGVAEPGLREDESGRDEPAAERADHEHDHQALAEGREGVHAVLAVGDDAGDERIGERPGEPLHEEGDVESRDVRHRESVGCGHPAHIIPLTNADRRGRYFPDNNIAVATLVFML